jgi:hypothetical protein
MANAAPGQLRAAADSTLTAASSGVSEASGAGRLDAGSLIGPNLRRRADQRINVSWQGPDSSAKISSFRR